jgi:glycosyltransferase involved in cell wall biosynthesis
MKISVIIPAHNPHPGRLSRVFAGLAAQTLPAGEWETLLVDNASARFPEAESLSASGPPNLRIIREPILGLTTARRAGFAEAGGELAVLVDDDNVLAPDYLAEVLALFDALPTVGALGGKSLPEFENPPPAWTREFFPLLALRDLGPDTLIATSLRTPGAGRDEYPPCSPIGAGMGLRRPAWTGWLEARAGASMLSDRRGTALTSSGDNDIVLCALRAGWSVAYSPRLSLTHLIPSARLEPDYLARLNRGIQQSWMQVLAQHAVNPWPPLTRSGAALRKAKAWFTYRGWSHPSGRIRWQGACGHFDGRSRNPNVSPA